MVIFKISFYFQNTFKTDKFREDFILPGDFFDFQNARFP